MHVDAEDFRTRKDFRREDFPVSGDDEVVGPEGADRFEKFDVSPNLFRRENGDSRRRRYRFHGARTAFARTPYGDVGIRYRENDLRPVRGKEVFQNVGSECRSAEESDFHYFRTSMRYSFDPLSNRSVADSTETPQARSVFLSREFSITNEAYSEPFAETETNRSRASSAASTLSRSKYVNVMRFSGSVSKKNDAEYESFFPVSNANGTLAEDQESETLLTILLSCASRIAHAPGVGDATRKEPEAVSQS